MWTAKFQFDGSDLLYGKTAKKFNAEVRGFSLNVYHQEDKNKEYVTSVGRFINPNADFKEVIDFVKKDPRLVNIEEHNGFFIITVIEDEDFYYFTSPNFVHISPVIISPKGMYTFHLASWKREELEKLIKKVEDFPKFKLLSLKEETITNVSISGLQPGFTEKQKQAYELAVKKGYYEYPKK